MKRKVRRKGRAIVPPRRLLRPLMRGARRTRRTLNRRWKWRILRLRRSRGKSSIGKRV